MVAQEELGVLQATIATMREELASIRSLLDRHVSPYSGAAMESGAPHLDISTQSIDVGANNGTYGGTPRMRLDSDQLQIAIDGALTSLPIPFAVFGSRVLNNPIAQDGNKIAFYGSVGISPTFDIHLGTFTDTTPGTTAMSRLSMGAPNDVTFATTAMISVGTGASAAYGLAATVDTSGASDWRPYFAVHPVLYLSNQTADPGFPLDGMFWYRSDVDQLYARMNSTTRQIITNDTTRDDLTQYVKLAGRSTGQTIYGPANTTQFAYLAMTSSATEGKAVLAASTVASPNDIELNVISNASGKIISLRGGTPDGVLLPTRTSNPTSTYGTTDSNLIYRSDLNQLLLRAGGAWVTVYPQGGGYTVQSKSTGYTAAWNEYVVCTSGSFTVTLPTAVGNGGKTIVVKNNGSGVITVDGNASETIDGDLTIIVPVKDAVMLVSDGTNVQII